MNEKLGWKHSFTVIKKMWRYAAKWKVPFFLSFLGASTTTLFFAFINSYLYQLFMYLCMDVDHSKVYESIKQLVIVIVVGILFYAICFSYLFVTSAKVRGVAKKAIYRHAQKLPVSFLHSRFSGDIATNSTKDFNDAIELTGNGLLGYDNPLNMIVTIVGSFLIMAYRNVLLACISLAISCVSLLMVNHYIKPLQRKEKKVKEASSEAAQEIVNTLSGMGVSRIFGFQNILKQRYEEKANDIYDSNVSVIRQKANIHFIADLQGMFASVGVIGIGLFMCLDKSIDVATVVFIANMQGTLSDTAKRFGERIANLQKNIVSGSRLIDFLEQPEEEERENQNTPDKNCNYAIEMNHISFQYESTSKVIFDDLNLHIKQGENVALVGSSGGGKSTIFKLLMEFEDLNQGNINLFGAPIESYSRKIVRSLFSYVPQDCYLFDGTIKDNILLGNQNASEEQLKDVIKKAYLSSFIDELEDGYNTQIGESGSKLSGGQKQRIAIARAMLKDAPIILLDEATSSLDSLSEKEVQKAFYSLMKGKTCITIAHRISTIKDADRILVLEDGKVVEEGRHDELLEKHEDMLRYIACNIFNRGTKNMECILNAEDIMHILPHRYPFLLLDGVTKLEYEQSVEGFKNYTMNEWYFQGHMPGKPVVPGVLIIESLAQLTAIMYCSRDYVESKGKEIVDVSERVGFLGGVKDLRFRRTVKPGERLRLTAKVQESYKNVFQVKVAAYSESNDCVAKGTITVTQNI